MTMTIIMTTMAMTAMMTMMTMYGTLIIIKTNIKEKEGFWGVSPQMWSYQTIFSHCLAGLQWYA